MHLRRRSGDRARGVGRGAAPRRSNATTTAKSVHSAGCLLAALLFAIPASQKRRALREACDALEILMVFCGCAENDDVDLPSARTRSACTARPLTFGRTEDRDATSGSGGGGGSEDKDEEMVGAEEKGPNVIRLRTRCRTALISLFAASISSTSKTKSPAFRFVVLRGISETIRTRNRVRGSISIVLY